MYEEDVVCPYCGCLLDRDTLFNLNNICLECGMYIPSDEIEDYNSGYHNIDYDDWEYEYEKERRKEEMELRIKDERTSFVFRFLTELDYDTIKKSFETLEGNIEYFQTLDGALLKDFLETDGGKKLLKGFNIEADKLNEYVLISSFGLTNDEAKKVLISTILQAFPLCVVREEGSSYIMTNNKGLAKGIIDVCNEDEVELLNYFITGFEKYKILCHYLYWSDEEYRKEKASDIMILWKNNSLISLDALRKPKLVPYTWQQILDENDYVTVSKSPKEPGDVIDYETMIETIIRYLVARKDMEDTSGFLNIISLRGMTEYNIMKQEDEKDAKTETK